MDLRILTNRQLLELTKTKSKEEKALTLEVIKLIKEVSARKLYLELNYGSLFEYVTKELEYEEGSALRRMNAASVLKDIPEVEQKIEDGSLTLSNICQAHNFFKKEEKLKAVKLTIKSKKEVLSLLENKSKREALKTLIKLSPNQIELKESERIISEDLIEIRVVINERLNTKLKKLKNLMPHANPNMTKAELIEKLCDMALKKVDPETKASYALGAQLKSVKSESQTRKTRTLPPPGVVKKEATFQAKPSRYIPTSIKREVYLRDKGCCTFKDHKSNQKCSSRHLLQYDHIKPFSHGGMTRPENLRLLCFNHHKLITERTFGHNASKF